LEIGKVAGCQIRGITVVGGNSNFVYREALVGEERSVRPGVVMVKQPGLFSHIWGDVFARFHAVAAKLRSRTRKAHFGLLVQILCAKSP